MRLRLAALFACCALPAAAQTLNIATGGAFTSMDPHFHNLGPNNVIASYVFDPLVRFDRKYQPEASLAVSWKTVNDTTWEFKLREGVKFTDGTPFTAEDVAFTYARVPRVPNSPGSFTFATKPITQVEIVDAHTIRVHSATPLPLLAYNLSNVNVVSRKIGEGAATSDYNSMKTAIGTGPFRVTELTVGERAVFERNESWWGARPVWAKVIYRAITNGASRNAAL
jgi:peptide/nickel transport system substrate-binding protein